MEHGKIPPVKRPAYIRLTKPGIFAQLWAYSSLWGAPIPGMPPIAAKSGGRFHEIRLA